MNPFRLAAVAALTALVLPGISPAASASESGSDTQVAGVIVQYEQGVAAFARNGEPTGANLLRGVAESSHLGGNLYALKFSSGVNQHSVRQWVARMKLDRRIAWAELDYGIESASVSPKTVLAPPLTKARAATGPRSLAARASVSSASPEKARVRLTWRTPAKRYGASVVGYRIEYSSNGGQSYRTLIGNTGSADTRIFVSDGVRAGISYRFRVRAITNDGSGTDTVGAVSNSVSALVRTEPKPVVVTSGIRIGPGNVTYLSQSLSDRGGFTKRQVRYRAVATAADIESVESSLCSATRCRFPDLLPDTSYTVEVFATNPLGSSSSNDLESMNDFYFPLQWYLNGQYGVSMPAAWKYSRGDGSKVVAVIDTGIKEHEQVNKSLLRNSDGSIYGYDFVTDITSAGDGDGEDSNPNDEGGDAAGGSSFHGTFVAGIIASQHDFLGTAGVAPNTKILPVRALGRQGGTISDLVRAVNWAAGESLDGVPKNRFPVSVINLSLGARELVPCSGAFSSVFESIIAKGITVVAAAGNEGRPSLSFPANCPGVLTVVATQALGDKATYSNSGTGSFISAPGGEQAIGSTEAPDSRGMIISAGVDDASIPGYRLSEGTSMATPIVSGIISLMYAMQPNISPARVRTILSNSVKPFAPASPCVVSGACGAGIINAQLALARTSALR